MIRFIMLCVTLLAISSPVLAAEFPTSIKAGDASLQKVGQGTLGLLWKDVYHSALYAPKASYDAAKVHAIEIEYVFSFNSEELVDETIKQMKKMTKISSAKEQEWRKQLAVVFPTVIRGDRIRAITYPKEKVAFTHNGKKTGTIEDAQFASYFSQIWLKDDSDYPSLTREMKGL